MLTIIIPAKELDEALFNTISNYKLNLNYDYEIIIVYDIADDEIHEKFIYEFKNDKRILLLLSPINGRINALNFGYLHSKGNIIKCVDADDILLEKYFEQLSIMENYSVHCNISKKLSIKYGQSWKGRPRWWAQKS